MDIKVNKNVVLRVNKIFMENIINPLSIRKINRYVEDLYF